MATETTYVHEGSEYPAVDIDGTLYPYTGTRTPEALGEFEQRVRLGKWKEETATAAVRGLGLDDLDRGGGEALHRLMWDLLDTVEPYSLTVDQLQTLARFVSVNEPMIEFLRCQILESQISEAQNHDGRPVVGGPTHRALSSVRESLEALTGGVSE